MIRSRLSALSLLLALGALLSSCGYLRDQEPWTATIIYEQAPDGSVTVTPLEIKADSNYGLVQVVNETDVKRGFAVPELAVFEEIPPGLTRTVPVEEARNGMTYPFIDQLHKGTFEGRIVVEYLDEEFRR